MSQKTPDSGRTPQSGRLTEAEFLAAMRLIMKAERRKLREAEQRLRDAHRMLDAVTADPERRRLEAERVVAEAQAEAERLLALSSAEAERMRVAPIQAGGSSDHGSLAREVESHAERRAVEEAETLCQEARRLLESASVEADRRRADADRALAESRTEADQVLSQAGRVLAAAHADAERTRSEAGTEGSAPEPPRRRPARPGALLAGLRQDHLLQNSFFIMLSTATMGLLGFLFWLVAARLYPVDQIGVATTLIAATNLLSHVGLLGFNTTLITSLPDSRTKNSQIDSAVLLVFGATVAAALAYILIIPTFTPALAFVRASVPMLLGFAVLTAFSAVNLLTDSAFIAYRAAKFNFVVDGVIQGGGKLVLVVVVVGFGSYGLFLASGLAALFAVLASFAFLIRKFSYRPRLKVRLGAVRGALRISAAHYVANLFNIVPIMALPLIVLNLRGAEDAGFFFVAFQVANLLYAVTYAVSQSLQAEGSYEGSEFGALARRSAKIQAAVIVPGAIALMAISAPLLAIFGGAYRSNAVAALLVLAAAAPAVALDSWTTALLRLTRSLPALVWSNVIFAALVCGLGALWAKHGLHYVALAWLLGNLFSGLAGGAWLLAQRSRRVGPTEAAAVRHSGPLVPHSGTAGR